MVRNCCGKRLLKGAYEAHPHPFVRRPDFCRHGTLTEIILNPGIEAKEWGQGNECQNLAGRITLTHRVTRPEFRAYPVA